MKKAPTLLLAAAALLPARAALATPSTTFWTPATTYTQPYLVPHLSYDTYVAEQGFLQNTYGLTLGVLPFEKLQGEIGFDLFYPGFTADYFQLNGKLTLPEGSLASWAPGLSLGISNVGFETDVSDYHLVHFTVGKTTPLGVLGVGGYYGAGSEALWTNSDGDEARAGFQASWVSPDVKLGFAGLDKVVFAADVATGKNWFAAAGGGVALYFSPAVALLTGPVFFFDQDYYRAGYGTDWLWTVQLDVDADVLKRAR